MDRNTSEALPPLIRIILTERRGYHHRFFYLLIVLTGLLLAMLYGMWVDLNQEPGGLLIIIIVGCPLLFLSAYLAANQRKQIGRLDHCLHHDQFTVVRGTLDGIIRLRYKRVRYIISGQEIEGTLVFPGFAAFQNTRVIDVITTYGQKAELYLLSGGLIAGVTYPELDNEQTNRPATAKDWQAISKSLWGEIKLYGYAALSMSVILIGVCWFIEYRLGTGWESVGMLLVVFNSVLLLLVMLHLLVRWTEIRALLNKNHRSVHIRVYHGTSPEWYLIGTRHGGTNPGSSAFNGYVRLGGGLHRIQQNIIPAERDLLKPLWTPIHIEYLVYKERLIFLRYTTNPFT